QVNPRRTMFGFRPTTQRALFVLRLAQKLGEPAAADHYAELARHHNDETLLLAFNRTMNHGHPPRDLPRRFHEYLTNVREQGQRSQGDDGGQNRLVAIKVERRSIAVAVFIGMRLDYHDVRHLRAEPEKADASAISFLNWVLGEFEIGSATMEDLNGSEIRRAGLNRTSPPALRDLTIPVWQVSKANLLAGYCHRAFLDGQHLR